MSAFFAAAAAETAVIINCWRPAGADPAGYSHAYIAPVGTKRLNRLSLALGKVRRHTIYGRVQRSG